MVGELSEDGKWIWDGDNWVPHATEEASPQMNEPSELVVEPSGSVGTLPVQFHIWFLRYAIIY